MAKRTQSPYSMIIALLPSLNGRELERLKKELCKENRCQRDGHMFKTVKVTERWLAPSTVEMVCTRCGKEKIV